MGQIQFDRKRPRQLVPDQRWIQRGLVLAVSGTSGGREIAWSSNGLIVNTRLGTISKAVRKPGAGGLYTGTQGTSVMKQSIATSAVNGSEFITLVTTAAPSTLANEIHALGFANDGGAALFNLEVSNAGRWRLQIRNNASVALNLAWSFAAVGRAETIVGRVSGYGGEAAIFTPSGKATGTCPSGPIGINTISVGFLDRNSGNIIEQGWEGWLGDQFVFDKALTDKECFEIQANPWCLWKASRIWVPLSAGGGAATVTPPIISSTASVGAHTVARTALAAVTTSRIESTATFGSATVARTSAAAVSPSRIASTATVGSHIVSVAGVGSVNAARIESTVSFGTATVARTAVAAVGPSRIDSTASIPTHTVARSAIRSITPGRIDSSAAFGVPSVSSSSTAQIVVGRIESTAIVRSPVVSSAVPGTIGRPVSDTSNSGWVASAGGALYPMLDEVTPDAGDYIVATSVGAVCELALNGTSYPGTASQVLKYRASSSTGNSIIVRLKNTGGATVRSATQALTPVDTEYAITLSPAEIAAITSGALSVQLESA